MPDVQLPDGSIARFPEDMSDAEIETGGAEAFFADMLAMELGDWHPRNDVPETEGLAMQKQESARQELEWLWNILEETAYVDFYRRYVREGPDMARSQALCEHCKRSDQRLKFGMSAAKFGRFR